MNDLETRFFAKVKKTDGCWLWTGYRLKNDDGKTYGRLAVNGHLMLAHRCSWQMANGEIPQGLLVLHSCDNQQCVRPDHLFLGTQLDNVRDMHRKGRDRKACGIDHHESKLTDAQVQEIRRRYVRRAVGVRGNGKALAAEFCVSHVLIYKIVKNQQWKHVQ